MVKNVQKYCQRIIALANEINSVISYRDKFNYEIGLVEARYQSGEFGYLKYKEAVDKILDGRTKEEWNIYYKEQIYELLKKAEYLNSQVFLETYQDVSFKKIRYKPRVSLFGFMRKPISKAKQRAELKKAIEEVKKLEEVEEEKPFMPEVEPVPELPKPVKLKKLPKIKPSPKPAPKPKPVPKPVIKPVPEPKPIPRPKQIPEPIIKPKPVKKIPLPPKSVEKKPARWRFPFFRKKVPEVKPVPEKPPLKIPPPEFPELPEIKPAERKIPELFPEEKLPEFPEFPEKKPKLSRLFKPKTKKPEKKFAPKHTKLPDVKEEKEGLKLIEEKPVEEKFLPSKRPEHLELPEKKRFPRLFGLLKPKPEPKPKIEEVPKFEKKPEALEKVLFPEKKPKLAEKLKAVEPLPKIEKSKRAPIIAPLISKFKLLFKRKRKAKPAPEKFEEKFEEKVKEKPKPEEEIKVPEFIPEEKPTPAKPSVTPVPPVTPAPHAPQKPAKSPLIDFTKIKQKFKKKHPLFIEEGEKPPESRIIEPESRIKKKIEEREEPMPEKPEIVFRDKGVKKKRKTLFDKILREEKEITTGVGKVRLEVPFGIGVIKHFLLRIGMRESPKEKRRKIIEKDIRLKFLRTGDYLNIEKIEHLNSDILKKEAKRVHDILTKERQLNIYKPSVIGTVSNLLTRDVTYALIDMFPDFFRQVYNNIRLSNLRILSNTYINIMVFSTLIAPLIALLLFPLIFLIQGDPFLIVIVKSLLMALLVGVTTFMSFYLYPSMKIKDRRMNIRTNLPFAINHMAAIASSGVRPDILFRLIASSGEYGEICVESEKVSQLINIFGYDLLSALNSVADSTPSIYFKEFLEGMISTIESGGGIEEYLNEKSQESLMNYEIERQKFTETISTLSDVYTGLLIAAPLFFVAALSLISILGGGIGGVPVDIIIAVGTYFVIPLLNIIFIIFIEISQPEV